MTASRSVKNFLWRPFTIGSSQSPQNIEAELSRRIIKEPKFHLLPNYGKLTGTVEDGNFEIKYEPLSALYSRGAGKVAIRGRIESSANGSTISGFLQGPPFACWILILISIGIIGFSILKFLAGVNDAKNSGTPMIAIGFILAAFDVLLFFFDRNANGDGEGKIFAVLNEVAK